KLKIGLEDYHCLRCYFEMQEAIEKKREQYLRRYGLVPEFKAGVHSGSVIAGEVGIIKRDITFSGDVLNTAARIQSKCNEYQVKILSSNSLLDQLSLDNNYIRLPLGDIELRGKGQRVALSTIQRYQH
nr:adenylate/guanylate cyclase domain-containing protein [Chitinophagaceae bacterium]